VATGGPKPFRIEALSHSANPDDSLHWTAAFALTVLCCALAGIAALPLAIPPGYSTPLYPAAGVALASVLVYGRRMLPAIMLGAFAVALWPGLHHHAFTPSLLVLPLLISIGAAVEAFLGAFILARFAKQPLTLSEPRDIVVFLFAAMLSCIASSAMGSASMWLRHVIPTSELPLNIATWWVGDVLGVLIAAPVILTLVGRPRSAWAPRRISVGVTLALVTLLIGLGIRQIVQWNDDRVRTSVDHDATSAAQALDAQLREPLDALEALRGVFIASDEVTPEEMRLATDAWLARGRLQAMAWSERMAREDVPAFEARVRAEGLPGYKVFGRAGAAGAAASAAPLASGDAACFSQAGAPARWRGAGAPAPTSVVSTRHRSR
jgi:hypothetical protein